MTVDAPRISVCLPTFNRAALLGACLPTLLSQTRTDFELLIGDNCSTDATAEVVASYPDPRVRYSRNAQNIGPVQNMNRLLSLARGEYVCIVHDDDLYAPEFLASESLLLDRHPRMSMVHCAVYEMDERNVLRRRVRAYPSTRVLEGRRIFQRFLEGHNVCCSTVMMRRSVLQAVGGFDTQYLCADFLMWLQLALRGDVGYVAEPLVRMRVHADTVTNWLDPARWQREFVAIVERGFDLAAASDHAVTQAKPVLLRRAAKAQGRRFLIAALSATARGDLPSAHGYAKVVEQFQASGAPRCYMLLAKGLANRWGQGVLRPLRRLRRTWTGWWIPMAGSS